MPFLALWAAAAFAPAGMLAPSMHSTFVYVRADVDAQGVIQSLRFREGTGERLQAMLRDRVSAWRFDPATIDGRPAAAQTTISIELKAGAEGQSIEIASVIAGIAPLRAVPPKYLPPAGNTKQRGSVVLRCKLRADGRCTEISVAEATAPEALQKNAAKALAAWRFEPEIVAGAAVESWILIPFCFSPNRQQGPEPTCQAAEQKAVAGSEPSRLKLRDPLAQR